MAEPAAEKKRQTYAAGCHCGYIRFDVTLSPPLDEYEVLECGCSICRRAGYLLVCTWTPPFSKLCCMSIRAPFNYTNLPTYLVM